MADYRLLNYAGAEGEPRPGIAVGAFCYAEAILAGIPLRGLVRDARDHLKHVHQCKPNSATDRCVGSMARAEQAKT